MANDNNRNRFWTEDELSSALDAYLYMLRLELSSVPFSIKTNSEVLRSGPLYRRNEASIRYRMRNISCVLEERGAPILLAFSPAPQVGVNVKRRLHALLDARASVLDSINALAKKPKISFSLPDATESLTKLKSLLLDISELQEKSRTVGIGHNNPPETLEFDVKELSEAYAAITAIESELAKNAADKKRIESESGKIAKLGMKIAIWSGERFTDFAKAGAVAAGTGFGLTLSILGGQIIDTLSALFGYLF